MIKLTSDDFKTNSSPKPVYEPKKIPLKIYDFGQVPESETDKPSKVNPLPSSVQPLPTIVEPGPGADGGLPAGYDEDTIKRADDIKETDHKITLPWIFLGIAVLVIIFLVLKGE